MEKINIQESVERLKKILIEHRQANIYIIFLGQAGKIINEVKAKYLEGVSNELYDSLETILNDFDDLFKQAQNEASQ